jgi:hypothetical protein
MLAPNGSQNGPTSSTGNLRSLEPHQDRSGTKSPLFDHSTDFDKGLSFPQKVKSKPLPLTPVISAFSTYKKAGSESRKSIREKGISLPIAAWKNPRPLPSPFNNVANESSKTSLSSFDAAWSTDQPSGGGLKAPQHVRREQSKEVLVGKEASCGKDGRITDEK